MCKSVFQMQCPICAVNFINNNCQGQTEHDTVLEISLTINFMYKYFHNSVDWSELYPFILKCISLYDGQKLSDF